MIQLIVVHYNRQTIDCQHSNHLLWFTARKPIQAELPSIYNAQCITIVWIIFKWIAHYIVFHFCFARVPTKSLFFFDYYFFYFFFYYEYYFYYGRRVTSKLCARSHSGVHLGYYAKVHRKIYIQIRTNPNSTERNSLTYTNTTEWFITVCNHFFCCCCFPAAPDFNFGNVAENCWRNKR